MNAHKRHKESLSMGQRAADVLRDSMGSWMFVFAFIAMMGAWMYTKGFSVDPMPFILLNLLLSTLAGLQGAILLISARRQDEIAAAIAQHDLETNLAAKREIELLQKHLHRLEADKLNIILERLTSPPLIVNAKRKKRARS